MFFCDVKGDRLKLKRFAKSFYSKTALKAVLCLFHQNDVKKLSGSVAGALKKLEYQENIFFVPPPLTAYFSWLSLFPKGSGMNKLLIL